MDKSWYDLQPDLVRHVVKWKQTKQYGKACYYILLQSLYIEHLITWYTPGATSQNCCRILQIHLIYLHLIHLGSSLEKSNRNTEKGRDMNVMLRPVEPQKAAGYEAMRHKAAGYEAHTYSQRTSEKIPFLRGLPLIFMISLRLQGHCLNCLGKHFVST